MRKQKFMIELDKEYMPCAVEYENYKSDVAAEGGGIQVKVALERNDGYISSYSFKVLKDPGNPMNCLIAQRLIKTLLWIKGGWKIIIGGPGYICDHIEAAFSNTGIRAFDHGMMSKIYEKPFTVVKAAINDVPDTFEDSKPVGRHFDGARIGFDAGGSDRKVSAVINGKDVFSEEVIWHPKINKDPEYHFRGIMESIKAAASVMPGVDAIGVSSAGVYINNRVMAASLFISVPDEIFKDKVSDIFKRVSDEMGGVPIVVANDGDVTALAGSIELNDTNVLGLAMGTSQAGGYTDGKGHITGWLNELAFAPVDFNKGSPLDDWSGDYGCGVNYFSQEAVIKLAKRAGIEFSDDMTPAQKLSHVQKLHEEEAPGINAIFEAIGIYLGYSLAWYSEFYDIKHVLILGRVTSGKGGSVILDLAKKVLNEEYPELHDKLTLHLPDEKSRRVGQSIAAASLPEIHK